MRALSKNLVKNGKPELATVVSSTQTGLTVNSVPQMEIVLDLQVAGQPSRRVSTKQMLGLGEIPRAGDMVYALVDQTDPSKCMIIPGRPQQSAGPQPVQYAAPQPVQSFVPPAYTPPSPQPPSSRSSSPFETSGSPFANSGQSPFGNPAPSAPQQPQSYGQPQPAPQQVYTQPGSPIMNAEQFKLDLFSLSPALRAQGTLAVATILSISRANNNATQFDLEVDSINAPKRPLTIEQVMYGPGYDVGDRVYLLIDPGNPNVAALIPLSVCGYQKIPRTANRLDSIVLGPELLHTGARAQGTIVASTEIPLGNPQLTAQGMCRYQITVRIQPENGDPVYTGEEAIGFKDRERAARMATVGATVAIRYDRNDPQSFSIDSEAMGYPDAYKPYVEGFRKQLNPDANLGQALH